MRRLVTLFFLLLASCASHPPPRPYTRPDELRCLVSPCYYYEVRYGDEWFECAYRPLGRRQPECHRIEAPLYAE
jgi:hypothetical protein